MGGDEVYLEVQGTCYWVKPANINRATLLMGPCKRVSMWEFPKIRGPDIDPK